ncbi:MAG: RNA pseudouridine synthase [Opitutaceae bacterium]|jgi:23S rRNA pseudouridine955/2504/2580 synthase|nr:RNA pseudouridine synthase [Opitutaceae bacterium]
MTTPLETLLEQLPLGDGVALLARDANGLFALSKPAGVLSHPNVRADIPRSLLAAPYSAEGEFYEIASPTTPGATRRVWLLNRLDSATSGVILLAADAALAALVRKAFLQKNVRKLYNALVFGTPPATAAVWRDRLAVRKSAGQIRASGGGNIPAETRAKVLRRWNDKLPPLTLLELEPRTGRSHQLRVQCALRKLPIVGDATYGAFAANRDFARRHGSARLFLHSRETAFAYTWKNRLFRFRAEAPLPPEFLAPTPRA